MTTRPLYVDHTRYGPAANNESGKIEDWHHRVVCLGCGFHDSAAKWAECPGHPDHRASGQVKKLMKHQPVPAGDDSDIETPRWLVRSAEEDSSAPWFPRFRSSTHATQTLEQDLGRIAHKIDILRETGHLFSFDPSEVYHGVHSILGAMEDALEIAGLCGYERI